MNNNTQFWAEHVAAAKLEAIPVSEYARRHNLAVKSLYYWRHKLEIIKPSLQAKINPIQSSTNLTPSVPGNKFVALQLATPRQTYCTLSMPSGLRLEISALPQPEWLAAFDCAVQSMPELR